MRVSKSGGGGGHSRKASLGTSDLPKGRMRGSGGTRVPGRPESHTAAVPLHVCPVLPYSLAAPSPPLTVQALELIAS